MVLDELNLPDSQALLEWVYVPERTPDDIARLAPVVEAAAVSGDSVADWLLTKAAEELADAVEAVARRLGCLDRLGCGSPSPAESSVRRLFAAVLGRTSSNGISADVHEPVLAPVAGAAIRPGVWGRSVQLHRRPSGREVPESLVAKLKAHMPELGPEKEARWKHESSRFAVGTGQRLLAKVSEGCNGWPDPTTGRRSGGCVRQPWPTRDCGIFSGPVIPICLPRKRFIGREDWSRWSLSWKAA